MERPPHSARHRRWSQASSAWSLRGRHGGRPRPRRTPGTASSNGRRHRARRAGWPRSSLEAERRALGPGEQRGLGPRPPAVRRVRPDLRARRTVSSRAPPLAGNEALSIDARLQSSAQASASVSSSTEWSRPHTLAVCQSRGRRQRVMPVQPNSPRGSLSQVTPDHSHEDDALQNRAITAPRAPILRLWGFGRQQRLHRRPQPVACRRSAHGAPNAPQRVCCRL